MKSFWCSSKLCVFANKCHPVSLFLYDTNLIINSWEQLLPPSHWQLVKLNKCKWSSVNNRSSPPQNTHTNKTTTNHVKTLSVFSFCLSLFFLTLYLYQFSIMKGHSPHHPWKARFLPLHCLVACKIWEIRNALVHFMTVDKSVS